MINKFQSTFPRGERHMQDELYRLCRSFNPRSREGNDVDTAVTGYGKNQFQSTFPRGERHILLLLRLQCSAVSIHVPARGTTIKPFADLYFPVSFNPRSREGNDDTVRPYFTSFSCFNPRSREGNDCFAS